MEDRYMTLNREFEPVIVRTYETGTDEYGAINQGNYTDRTVEGVVKLNGQSNVLDPRYIDVTYIMITKDKNITDANTVIYQNKEYTIKYLIPTHTYLTVLLGNG